MNIHTDRYGRKYYWFEYDDEPIYCYEQIDNGKAKYDEYFHVFKDPQHNYFAEILEAWGEEVWVERIHIFNETGDKIYFGNHYDERGRRYIELPHNTWNYVMGELYDDMISEEERREEERREEEEREWE